MAELIVVTGPPGAGKSTVARVLADSFDSSALVVGDDFFGCVRGGLIPPWLPEAHEQNTIVIEAAAAAAGRLAAGYPVVYDGVIGPWFLAEFLAATGLSQLHYAVLLPSEQRCLARVRSRVGHGFTDLAAARQVHQQFAEAPIQAQHLVAEPSDQPLDTAALLRARMTDGSLTFCQH
jgi:predicted ABC-type ATPase